MGVPKGSSRLGLPRVSAWAVCLIAVLQAGSVASVEANLGDAGCPKLAPDAAKGADLQIAWYPYASKLRTRIDLSAVPGADSIRSAEVSLRARGTPGVLLTAPVALTSGRADAVHPVPALPSGHYEVGIALSSGPDCAPRVGPSRSFEHRLFGWEHNDLGEGDDVIPPLTPLRVSGNVVSAVLRDHTLNAQGLPDRIRSLDEELLAAPVTYRLQVAGRAAQPSPAGPIQIRQESPGRVTSEAQWSAAGLRARARGSIEVDGMWRTDLELSGDGIRLDRLDLVIPLRAERARLMNAISDGALHHALGEVPAGQGVVWDSLRVGRVALSPEWVPYVWLGDEERGLAWFAASLRGGSIAPGQPSLELVRRGDVVELVVHLVARPIVLRGTRGITFGLQATPAKPRPEQPRAWRSWQLVCESPVRVFRLCPLASGQYWGSQTPYGNLKPRDGDDSLLRALARVRKRGSGDPSEVERWLEARRGSDRAWRDTARAGLLYSLHALAQRPDAVALYANLHGSAWTPEFATHVDEWRSEPFGDRSGGDANEWGEIKTRASGSWNDYVLSHLDRLLDTGAMDGFFFDNTYLKADFDEVDGSAWRDEDGWLRPGVDLFAMRELLKRAQLLVYRKRGAWFNVSHMTTTPIAPIQVWSGVSISGEWKYGQEDYQDRFPRALLRAESLGAQAGSVPVYLPGLTGDPSPSRRTQLERSLAGVTALHEIRVAARMEGPYETIWRALHDFGYAESDAVVQRYWDAGRGFATRGADSEALVVARNGRALALLVSFGAGGNVEIEFDGSLPAFAAGGSCRDVEGRSAPAALPRGCRVRLERHDFRLVAYSPPQDRR